MIELGSHIKATIGLQLRLMYDEVANQGVPDRLVEMLRGLDHPIDVGSKNEPHKNVREIMLAAVPSLRRVRHLVMRKW
jgi:hypothetical protein